MLYKEHMIILIILQIVIILSVFVFYYKFVKFVDIVYKNLMFSSEADKPKKISNPMYFDNSK